MRVKDPAMLRRKRLNRKLSQDQLAYLCGVKQQTISLIERGKMKTCTEGLALLIGARLDVDWEEYFVLETDEVAPDVRNSKHSIPERMAS